MTESTTVQKPHPIKLEKVDQNAVDRYSLHADGHTVSILDHYPDKQESADGQCVGTIRLTNPDIWVEVVQLKTDDSFGKLMVLIQTASGLVYSAIPGAEIKMAGLELHLSGTSDVLFRKLPGKPSNHRNETRKSSLKDYNVFILGAGISSRMLPMAGDSRTNFCKPAMWLFDAPMIFKLTESLRPFGLKQVIINTYVNPLSLEKGMATSGHGKYHFHTLHETALEKSVKEAVQALSQEKQDNLPKVYFFREKQVSGTAGPLYKLISLMKSGQLSTEIFDSEKPLLIIQGDAVTNADFTSLLAAHENNRADITIACKEVPKEEAKQFGMILTDKTGPNGSGTILEFREKPKELNQVPNPPLASTGFYVISPRVLRKIEALYADAPNPNEFDYAKNIFTPLVAGKHLDGDEAPVKFYAHVLEEHEYWGDFGNPEAYIFGVLEVAANEAVLRATPENPAGVALPEQLQEYIDLENAVVYGPGAKSHCQQDHVDVLRGGILVKEPYCAVIR